MKQYILGYISVIKKQPGSQWWWDKWELNVYKFIFFINIFDVDTSRCMT